MVPPTEKPLSIEVVRLPVNNELITSVGVLLLEKVDIEDKLKFAFKLETH